VKPLLRFALKRRLLNPISLSLQGLFIVVLLGAFFFDYVSAFFNLGFDQAHRVEVNDGFKSVLQHPDQWARNGFQFVSDRAELRIEYDGEVYRVQGAHDALLQNKVSQMLLLNHQQKILTQSSEQVFQWLEHYENIELEFESQADLKSGFKQQIIFIFLTSMYFMMLNFIAVNSNEIILEKTSNIIPLLLSSITLLQHYMLKLVLGFISVLTQLVSTVAIFGTLLWLRHSHDRFEGLLKLATKYFNLPSEGISLSDMLTWLDLTRADAYGVLLAMSFMLVGIFTVQVLVLVLSSRVKTMEEAASIQGPFYLGLLLLYYVSLGLNQGQTSASNLLTMLSFMPIGSLMTMPIRILSGTVYGYELLISGLLNLSFVGVLLIALFPIYRAGILDDRVTL
jgi:ABC-2 type transport system permease protein